MDLVVWSLDVDVWLMDLEVWSLDLDAWLANVECWLMNLEISWSMVLPLLGVWLGLIELVAGTLGDVSFGGGLVEAAAAVRALHVVRVLGGWRGW